MCLSLIHFLYIQDKFDGFSVVLLRSSMMVVCKEHFVCEFYLISHNIYLIIHNILYIYIYIYIYIYTHTHIYFLDARFIICI